MILKLLIKIIRLFIKPQKNTLLFHSFPDFSDNSFSFFCYVINHHKEYQSIWLINGDDKEKFYKLISNYTTSKNFKIYKKKSLLGLYYFSKSKYVFHTHGVFNDITLSKKQINVNLWHGMPLKNIGHLDNNKRVPKSNYVISTSKLFQEIMSKAFDLDMENVINSGQPRNDFIFSSKFSLLDLINKQKKDFKKVVLWMPTYRKSIIGDVRIDGEFDDSNNFLEKEQLSKLNVFFESINSMCFVKLHPMDFMKVKDFNKYSNLFFLDNSNFEGKGISLYSVLNQTDLLLTDFSSIYIDYLLLDKPIAFLVSDFDQYKNSRGFVFNKPTDFMPGEIIKQKEDLIPFLEKTFVYKQDLYKEKRKKITEVFHEPKNNFSQNVFNIIIKK